MTTDTVGDLREQLGFLAGDFSGEEELHETAWTPAARARGRSRARFSPAGSAAPVALILEQVQETEGRPDFAATSVFARDGVTGGLFLYAFDSLGYLPDPPARGAWIDGELVFTRSTERGHSRTRFARTAAGYRWSKEFRAADDAEWATVVEGELVAEPA